MDDDQDTVAVILPEQDRFHQRPVLNIDGRRHLGAAQ
jgi:hypothetical protein